MKRGAVDTGPPEVYVHKHKIKARIRGDTDRLFRRGTKKRLAGELSSIIHPDISGNMSL